MTISVSTMRDTVGVVARLLSSRDIEVTQSGISAFVQYDKRTNEPMRVNIPYIPDNAGPDLLEAVQGFIDHEVAHLLFSDFKALGEGHARKVAELHNVIEDTFIERKIPTIFPGSAINLDRLRQFMIDKIIEPKFQELKEAGAPPQILFMALGAAVFRAWAGQKHFVDYMKDKWALIQPVVDMVDPAMISRIPIVKNSWETLEVAEGMKKALTTPPPPPTPSKSSKKCKDPKDGEEGEEGEEGEPGKSDKNEKKPKDEKEPAGGAGGEEEKEKEESGEDEKSSTEKKKSKKDESKDKDEDEGEEGKSDSEAGDPNDSEAGDEESESAGGSEEKDEDEAEGEGSDEGSDADGDDEDEEEGSEGSGDADGDDDHDADEHKDDADESESGGEEKASKGLDAGDSGKSDDEAEGEGARGELDEMNPTNEVTEAQDAKEENHEELGEDSAGIGKEDAEPEPRPIVITAEDLENIKGTEDAIAEAIQKDLMSTLKEADYLVFSTRHDVIEKPVDYEVDQVTSGEVEAMCEKTDEMVGVMQKDFERAIFARTRTLHTPGQRSGRIHGANLFRLKQGDTRVFRRKVDHKSRDVAFMLVPDNSGSMYGEKVATAMYAGYALASVLERLNIKHEVIGFTTRPLPYDTMMELREAEDKLGQEFGREGERIYARRESLYMPIFKGVDERMTPTVRKRFIWGATRNQLQNNVDGECLELAYKRLKQIPAARHAMIVLSDGQPNCGAGMGLKKHLKKVVREIEESGTDVFGIGIQDHSVKSYYRRNVVLGNISDLPKVVMGELGQQLLEGSMGLGNAA